jgi:hypothetical protein
MRVPSGDAVSRVYGAGGPLDLVVVEIENASPAPFVVAVSITGTRAAVGLDGSVVTIGDEPAVIAARPPARWAAGEQGTVFAAVRDGDAPLAPFPGVAGRRNAEVALLYPVTHRTRARFALVQEPRGPSASAVDVGLLPAADDAARGWHAQLERGMRVELPDARLEEQVDAARATALLEGRDVAALEDWGFDVEAAAAWSRLSLRERRRAARRRDPSFLVELRRQLVEDTDETVVLLRDLPPEWRGASLAVHDAPTRAGRVSYAVRWHGDRPALLWDCERAGVRLTAPALDPTWSTTTQSGEALLG